MESDNSLLFGFLVGIVTGVLGNYVTKAIDYLLQKSSIGYKKYRQNQKESMLKIAESAAKDPKVYMKLLKREERLSNIPGFTMAVSLGLTAFIIEHINNPSHDSFPLGLSLLWIISIIGFIVGLQVAIKASRQVEEAEKLKGTKRYYYKGKKSRST